MSRILLFSRDPGGANTIAPLVKRLCDKGYDVYLYGKDTALEVYRRYGLACNDLTKEVPEINPGSVKRFIENISPHVIITGTSAEDFTERYIWQAANGKGIFSMAILDQWLNYGIRFSKYGVSGISGYSFDRKLDYIPSRVLVMDERAREEAVSDGIDPEVIIVSGQPHFETILEDKLLISSETIASLRNSLGAGGNDKVVVFVSEPISKDYGNAGNTNFLGYDEKTVFSEVEKALDRISSEIQGKIIFVVRPHPREAEKSWSGINGKISENIKYIVDRKSSSILLACSSDLIVGMSSMFLIEAAILEKPIMSVQIGLTGSDPFVLSKRGSVKTITEKCDLQNKLRSALRGEIPDSCDFDFIKNAAERIVFLVEEKLCRN